MYIRRFTTLLAAMPVLWATLASAEVTGSPGPTQLFGHITSDRTLTVAAPGPNYEIIGDLTIDAGVTLTVESGVALTPTPFADFIASGVDRGRVEVVVRGALVGAAGAGPTRIGFGVPGSWIGLRVEGGGTLDLENSEVIGGKLGIAVSTGGTLRLRSVAIYLVQDGLDLASGSVARIAGSSITGLGRGNAGRTGVNTSVSITNPDSLSPEPNRVEGFYTGIVSAAGPIALERMIVRDCVLGIATTYVTTLSYCTTYGNELSGLWAGNTAIGNFNAMLFNSIFFDATPIGGNTHLVYANYCNAYGANGEADPFGAATTGSRNASYDPYFEGPTLALHPASFFTSYSVSGGEIGAYGPGPVGPTPILTASVVEAIGTGGRAKIRWFAEARGSSKAGIFRRTEEGDWQPLTVLYPDGQGYVTLEDRDVRPGTRYGYGVGVQRDGQVGIEGEVWVKVEPLVTKLALASIEPNPASASWGLAFMSPEAAEARVEVVDLGGRVVRSVELGRVGIGRQSVSVSARGLAPGVYWLRLRQVDHSVIAKAIRTN